MRFKHIPTLLMVLALIVTTTINANAETVGLETKASEGNIEEVAQEKSVLAFLAPLLIDTLKEVVTSVVQHGANTILDNINCSLSTSNGTIEENPTQEETPCESDNEAVQVEPSEEVSSEHSPLVTSVPLTVEQAEILAQQPLVAISVSKYATADANSEPIDNISFKFGNPLGFTIKTGEYFALKFDTSTPGQVKLINTDANGEVENIGFYEVIGTAENRMPRQANILMYGATGVETLDLEFTPCVSEKLQEDPRVAPYKGVLPMCDSSGGVSGIKASSPAMKRVARTKGMYNAEAAVNPEVALLAVTMDKEVGATQTIRLNVNHISDTF